MTARKTAMKKFKVRLHAWGIYKTTVEAETKTEAETLAREEAEERITTAWETTECEEIERDEKIQS